MRYRHGEKGAGANQNGLEPFVEKPLEKRLQRLVQQILTQCAPDRQATAGRAGDHRRATVTP